MWHFWLLMDLKKDIPHSFKLFCRSLAHFCLTLLFRAFFEWLVFCTDHSVFHRPFIITWGWFSSLLWDVSFYFIATTSPSWVISSFSGSFVATLPFRTENVIFRGNREAHKCFCDQLAVACFSRVCSLLKSWNFVFYWNSLVGWLLRELWLEWIHSL